MEDLQTLRETIATLLADYLGTYTYSNGLTTPAIAIDDGSQPTSDTGQQLAIEDAQVTGLEVVIQRGRSPRITEFLSTGRQVETPLEIVLKQWDITRTTIDAQYALLAGLDLPIREVRPVPRLTRLDNIETCTFVVPWYLVFERSPSTP